MSDAAPARTGFYMKGGKPQDRFGCRDGSGPAGEVMEKQATNARMTGSDVSRRRFMRKTLTIGGTLAAIGATEAVLEAVFKPEAQAQMKCDLPPAQQAMADVIASAIDTGDINASIQKNNRGRLNKQQVEFLRKLTPQDLATLKKFKRTMSTREATGDVGGIVF